MNDELNEAVLGQDRSLRSFHILINYKKIDLSKGRVEYE